MVDGECLDVAGLFSQILGKVHTGHCLKGFVLVLERKSVCERMVLSGCGMGANMQ